MRMVILEPDDIRQIREALGLSPTDFASKLGVSASAVSRWESGKGNPTVKKMRTINKIAAKAGIVLNGVQST